MIVIFHFIVITLIGYNEPGSSLQSKLQVNLFDVKNYFSNTIYEKPNSLLKFNQKIDKKFESIYGGVEVNDENRFLYLLELFNNEHSNEIIIPEYLTDPDTYENPHLQDFDPRFTLGLIFDYLSTSLRRVSNLDDVSIPYFHWSDWSDLSVLDEYLLSNDKSDCVSFFDVSTNNRLRNKKLEILKPEDFCLNDKDIELILNPKDQESKEKRALVDQLIDLKDEETLKALRKIKDEPYSTNWHIFKYPGRSKKKLKIIQSKSYLNDFMPPPLAINFLLPFDKSKSIDLRVQVNQKIENKKKLMDTDLAQNYAKRYRRANKELLDVSKDIILNIRDQTSYLVDVLKKKLELFEDLNEDEKKLHLINLVYQQSTSYSKFLEPQDFIDNSTNIHNQLQLENTKKILSDSDLNYMNSLNVSLDTGSPSKYFDEAKILKKELNWALGGHYDWRFFSGIINYTEKQPPVLFGLIRAWLTFTNTYGLNTWIAHGSLLSWYWNGISFPWDNDIDVQMPIADLHKLSRYHNQSLIVDLGQGGDEESRFGRYFLDCGTFILSRVKGNGNNNIDARFIDVDTGLYIDITGLALTDTKTPTRFNHELPSHLDRNLLDETISDYNRNEWLEAYNCRNNHFVRLSEVNPLKLSIIEGQPGYIPNNFAQLLHNEYGKKGLMAKKFKGFTFLPKLRMWLVSRNLNKFLHNQEQKQKLERGEVKRDDEEEEDYDNIPVKHFKDEDYIDLLFDQPELLVEYILTRNITEFHEHEIKQLLNGKDTKSMLLHDDHLKTYFPTIRHDYFTYCARRENYKFERMVEDKLKQVKLSKEAPLETKQDEQDQQNQQDQDQRSKPIQQGPGHPPLLEQTQEATDDISRTRVDPHPNQPDA